MRKVGALAFLRFFYRKVRLYFLLVSLCFVLPLISQEDSNENTIVYVRHFPSYHRPVGFFCSYPRRTFDWPYSCPYYPFWETRFQYKKEEKPVSQSYIQQLFDSAFLGSAHAQYVIGYRYQEGKTFKKDLSRAYAWYQVASYHGHPSADFMLDRLTGNMNSDQIFEGDTRSAEIIERVFRKTAEQKNVLHQEPFLRSSSE